MIVEDYCSYEIAKLLKEKGFDAEIHMYWGANPANPKDTYIERCPKELEVDNNCSLGHHPEDFECIAPTIQMAMKWLREVHHITIGITFSLNIITYEIEKDEEFITAIGSSRSYEDMVEEAIKYCLENLI